MCARGACAAGSLSQSTRYARDRLAPIRERSARWACPPYPRCGTRDSPGRRRPFRPACAQPAEPGHVPSTAGASQHQRAHEDPEEHPPPPPLLLVLPVRVEVHAHHRRLIRSDTGQLLHAFGQVVHRRLLGLGDLLLAPPHPRREHALLGRPAGLRGTGWGRSLAACGHHSACHGRSFLCRNRVLQSRGQDTRRSEPETISSPGRPLSVRRPR
jgi:hypothetical protein